MRTFAASDDVVTMTATIDDIKTGAEYAEITLPWTFNRMMLNTGATGQCGRALNIAKGIVAQEVMKRVLNDHGVSTSTQRKSHRDEDLFDFQIGGRNRDIKLDIKTNNYYYDYDSRVGRNPLTAKLLAENRDYEGPDWRSFFPMLVPHTQIHQSKEAYCFAFIKSSDPRGDQLSGRPEAALTAFPYGEALGFFSSKRLCEAREEEGVGFSAAVGINAGGLYNGGADVTVIGEYGGEKQRRNVSVVKTGTMYDCGEWSCISAIQIDRETYQHFAGELLLRATDRGLHSAIRNTAKRNINVLPQADLLWKKEEFVNLYLPHGFEVLVVGWIPKAEFLESCRKYRGWIWPNDSVNKFHNQAWSRVTENDAAMLDRAGFGSSVSAAGVGAGFMKTHGGGGGACCYVFPNMGRNGGVKETNLYVLPQDLYAIDRISEYLG